MGREQDGSRRPFGARSPAADRDAFAADLKHRRQAAQRLEKDLLTEVPLLYGDPDGIDPGIALQRIHQEELIARHGGGAPPRSKRRSDNSLPYEGATTILALLLVLLFLFLD